MPRCFLHSVQTVFALVLLCFPSVISAQQPDPRIVETDQPEKTTLPSGVNRIAGLEANSKIHYVCLIPFESLDTPSLGDSPSLIAQCTLKPSGKSSFELFANFGGATDLTFYPRGHQPQRTTSFLHAPRRSP
jgi:hypothetical protein